MGKWKLGCAILPQFALVVFWGVFKPSGATFREREKD